jgi:DNA-binding Lrp family transcriptional regulator
MVNVELGHEKNIINGSAMSAGISSFEGVVHADIVLGEYDIIVVIEGDPKAIDETIQKLRKIPHVKKTKSLLTMN